MADYIPSPSAWVREQVEQYEGSGGREGTTLLDTGLPVIIVTHIGNKTGAIRKTPLMRVQDGSSYVLVGSQGGAPKNPAWVHNLRINPDVEIRDETAVQKMRVREIADEAERLAAVEARGRSVSALRGLSETHGATNSGLCCGAGVREGLGFRFGGSDRMSMLLSR